MQEQIPTILMICAGFLLVDLYLIGGIRIGLKKWKFSQKRAFTITYWVVSILFITGIFLSIFLKLGLGFRAAFMLGFFLLLIGKALFLPFILIDDLRRLFLWIDQKSKKTMRKPKGKIQNELSVKSDKKSTPDFEKPSEIDNLNSAFKKIPRSEFLMKAGLLAGSIPLAGLTYGTISGVYDYRVKHRTLYLPNLPKAFDGIKLGQISDIHSGSFYNKKAVAGGVELLLKEKPDFIFFTGDLVNSRTSEMYGYQDIFSKVKAPLGVYSSLGNHDYGDYADWPNEAAKKKNLKDLITTHKNMGWDLLMNTNRRLKVNGEEIGILGVENWGSLSRFPKYGKLDLAVKNTDDLPVKLLLSHDPSHWRGQVLPHYPQIDVMFSGHTHGMQFGIQTEYFQWSPVQYIYKEWAGLYREGNQQLYVNVGYGFLGYPGRLGILPEITIFELKCKSV